MIKRRKKRNYSLKEKSTLDLDNSFRLTMKKNYEIKTMKFRIYENRGKYNLLKSPFILDTKNKIIIEHIPFREFERKFYRFKDWLQVEIINKFKLIDGEYFIHGRCMSKREIRYLYQVPLIHFRVSNSQFDDGFMKKKTHRKGKEHGQYNWQTSREYKIYKIFTDLKY